MKSAVFVDIAQIVGGIATDPPRRNWVIKEKGDLVVVENRRERYVA